VSVARVHFHRQVAISPYTAKGTVVNEPTPVSPMEGVHFEHSSIPKSLHALFAPGAAPLTAREVFAAPFHEAVLNLDEPRTDCLTELPTPASHRELSGLGPIDGHRPLSGLQVRTARVCCLLLCVDVRGSVQLRCPLLLRYLHCPVAFLLHLACAVPAVAPCNAFEYACLRLLVRMTPQRELAAVAAGVVGDSLADLTPLVTEQDGAEYIADCVNKVFGRSVLDVPRNTPFSTRPTAE
jgi:hypothetical protein